jgi:hypothetical protein
MQTLIRQVNTFVVACINSIFKRKFLLWLQEFYFYL